MNNRANPKVALLATVASILVTRTAAADDAVKLAWIFKQGQKLNYVVEQGTTSEGQFAGHGIKSTVSQTSDMQWNIESAAADGTAQMTQTKRPKPPIPIKARQKKTASRSTRLASV